MQGELAGISSSLASTTRRAPPRLRSRLRASNTLALVQIRASQGNGTRGSTRLSGVVGSAVVPIDFGSRLSRRGLGERRRSIEPRARRGGSRSRTARCSQWGYRLRWAENLTGQRCHLDRVIVGATRTCESCRWPMPRRFGVVRLQHDRAWSLETAFVRATASAKGNAGSERADFASGITPVESPEWRSLSTRQCGSARVFRGGATRGRGGIGSELGSGRDQRARRSEPVPAGLVAELAAWQRSRAGRCAATAPGEAGCGRRTARSPFSATSCSWNDGAPPFGGSCGGCDTLRGLRGSPC